MNYWAQFGASTVSGLAPTFIQFRTTAGGTLAPPSVSEPGSFGMYMFAYNAATQIAFVLDGATSGLAFADRYVTGVLDPFDNFGTTLVAIGNTAIALGVTNVAIGISNIALGVSSIAQGIAGASLIGTTASSFGTNSVDPTTVFGFLKRALETREGNETYVKTTGILDVYSRGSSQLLAEKTITDSTSTTTKT